jgi:hypothetical protein
MSGKELAPRPYLENLIVLEIKTNKQTLFHSQVAFTVEEGGDG